jgi:hypothetical protein
MISVHRCLGYDVLLILFPVQVSVAGCLGYDVLVQISTTPFGLPSFSCWLFRL